MNKLLRHIRLYEEKKALHSGGLSDVFFDVPAMLTDPETSKFILNGLEDDIDDDIEYDVIIGIEFGGAILAALLAHKLYMPVGFYRKDGTLIMPEGIDAVSAIVVDDVKTTGNSMIDATNALEKIGIDVVQFLTVVDRAALLG